MSDKSAFGNGFFKGTIDQKIESAFAKLGISGNLARSIQSRRPELSDFQCNGLLAHANTNGFSAFTLAETAIQELGKNSGFDVAVAGPGFLNFCLHDNVLAQVVSNRISKSDWCVPRTSVRHTIFLDYGGPNVAKELHVGHLRSALIGQTLTNIFRLFGYRVVTDVHLGDWGLQMGLTMAQIETDGLTELNAKILGNIYSSASKRAKTDTEFLNRARAITAKLQAGDEQITTQWEQIVTLSVSSVRETYDRLGVSFDQWNGESHYQPLIPEVIAAAQAKGVTEFSDGALIVRAEKGEIPPLILRNSAGAVGYAATDLAALSARVEEHMPDEILYVVDKRQKLHFEQVFSVSKRTGLLGDCIVEHVPFGTVNGPGGRPFKTRDGHVMRLDDLLNLMTQKARERIQSRSHIEDIDTVSWLVAQAAIKYGELSHDRASNYVFDPDRFLAFEGNTGPYLLYTSVRTTSLLTRAAESGIAPCPISTLGNGGRQIVLRLDSYGDVLRRVLEKRRPSLLASHLYGLANAMNVFYQQNQVLARSVQPDEAGSYLTILQVAETQLRAGLQILGIQVPKQM